MEKLCHAPNYSVWNGNSDFYMSALSAIVCGRLRKKCDHEKKEQRQNKHTHTHSFSGTGSQKLREEGYPSPHTPHTHSGGKEPSFSPPFRPCTKPPRRVILLRALSLSTHPTPHPLAHPPSAINPAGVKSLSLFFSHSSIRWLALTSLKSPSILFPSSSPPPTPSTLCPPTQKVLLYLAIFYSGGQECWQYWWNSSCFRSSLC